MSKQLEALAGEVRRSGQDTKWRELSHLLGEIFTPAALSERISEPAAPFGSGPIPKHTPSPRQKLVLFTEHRDTLNYLERQISALLGRPQRGAELLEEALEITPGERNATWFLANVRLAGLDDPDGAAELFAALLDTDDLSVEQRTADEERLAAARAAG